MARVNVGEHTSTPGTVSVTPTLRPRSGLMKPKWAMTMSLFLGGTPVWTQLGPAGAVPRGRVDNSTTYDPTTNSITIFGGFDANNNALGDAWVLTNANGLGGAPTWSQIAASSAAFPTRGEHTAVYNPLTNTMTIFGGAAIGLISSLNDVWCLATRMVSRCTPSSQTKRW